MIPEDPVILLSFVNTKLRDEYPSLDELCASPEICTNMSELLKLTKEKEANETTLASLYERWEELAE